MPHFVRIIRIQWDLWRGRREVESKSGWETAAGDPAQPAGNIAAPVRGSSVKTNGFGYLLTISHIYLSLQILKHVLKCALLACTSCKLLLTKKKLKLFRINKWLNTIQKDRLHFISNWKEFSFKSIEKADTTNLNFAFPKVPSR